MSDVYKKWKWCSNCKYRETHIVKEGMGVIMGVDKCWVSGKWSDTQWVYPFMDGDHIPMDESCPYYAEALVEELNSKDSMQ